MALDRVNEKYRRHIILAAKRDGQFKGRVFKNKEAIHECDGASIDGIIEELKAFVDESIQQIAESRQAPPSDDEYLRAFQNMLETLSDGHRAMLKAHYNATDQTITATELAKAAGYATYNSVNLQYGSVGFTLNEELPIKLLCRADGTPIATTALAEPVDPSGPEKHWDWKLRPGVAYAIEKLGLHKKPVRKRGSTLSRR
jgi:hypothetical protein